MGKSKTKSTTAPSYAWTYAPQASALQGLYSQSQNALSGATQQANYMQNLGNQAVGSQLDPNVSGQAFNTLSTVAQNAAYNPANTQLASMGTMGGYNPAAGQLNRFQQGQVDPALGAYQRQVQQNFQNNIMPGINMQSAAAGQLGSSRGQIAGQQVGLQANQQVADMAAKLYGENANRALQAAQTSGQLYNQSMANAIQAAQSRGGLYNQGQQAALQAAQIGLGSQTAALGQLPQLAGISQQPYINQAQILGTSPLALSVGGGGGSSGKSKSL
jgi:hypothetical protein